VVTNDALDVLCAQLTWDMFAIAKFLLDFFMSAHERTCPHGQSAWSTAIVVAYGQHAGLRPASLALRAANVGTG